MQNTNLPQYLADHDKAAATHLVTECLKCGYTLSVYDGEEWTVKRSQDVDAICAALGSTSDDKVSIRGTDGAPVASFWLVWGNSPGELLADYSDNAEAERIANVVNAEWEAC